MATTATQLLDAIYIATQNDYFQKNETRSISKGAFDSAWSGRTKLIPSTTLESIKKSTRQPTKIDVWQKKAASNATARKCEGTGGASTARQTVTYSGIVEEFTISALEFADNNFSKTNAIAHNIAEAIRLMDEKAEAAAVAYLESIYSAGLGNIYYNNAGAKQVPLNHHQIGDNKAPIWLNYAKAEMMRNRYTGQLQLVGDTTMSAIAMAMLNQGAGNQHNTGFQFSGVDMKFSNSILNNSGVVATGFLFEQGMFGALTWINALHRNGEDIGTDVWTRMAHPIYGFDIEVKINKKCANNSSNVQGAQADYIESFVMYYDLAFLTGYTSDANTGIYKYELLNDNSASGSSSFLP